MKILAFALSLILASSGFAQDSIRLSEKIDKFTEVDLDDMERVDRLEIKSHLFTLQEIQEKREILNERIEGALGYRVKTFLPYFVAAGSTYGTGVLLGKMINATKGPGLGLPLVGFSLVLFTGTITAASLSLTHYERSISDMTNEELLNEEASLQKRAEEVIIKVQTILARYNMGSNE